ncbi:hypothetical protein BIW11_08282, partial [Tropilaelaps mercedesae]
MMTRRLIQIAFAVVLIVLLMSPNTAEARKLKKLAKAALLGAAIAPRFVPIPIPHHVYPKPQHGWDHDHSHGWDHGYPHGWDSYGH